ncbi:hypothetical protein N0V90_007540 [Kalmusia sp. IMI 367209]|nr:hypothetical protein N0V90_007540 [Kalmusia sp. IMI 367209]
MNINIKTWEDRDKALIDAQIIVLGRVRSVVNGGGFGKQIIQVWTEQLNIFWHDQTESRTMVWQARFSAYGSAKKIENGDYVALTQGSEWPIIIRECLDYFEIISVSTVVENVEIRGIRCYDGWEPSEWDMPPETMSYEDVFWQGHWLEFSALINRYPYEFTLIWDWGTFQVIPPSRRKRIRRNSGLIDIQRYSLVRRGLETEDISGKRRLRRVSYIARLLDDLDDEEGLKLLWVQFWTDWTILRKQKSVEDPEIVSYLEKLRLSRVHHSMCRRSSEYEWVRQQYCELSAYDENNPPTTFEFLERHFSEKHLLRPGLSNFIELPETQFMQLLAKLNAKDFECYSREGFCVMLLSHGMNVTEAMLEHALTLKGPLAKGILDLHATGLTITEQMLIAAASNFPYADYMLLLLFDHLHDVSFLSEDVFRAVGLIATLFVTLGSTMV